MERPSYLSRYVLDWDLMDVVLSGHSALDSKYFIAPLKTQDQVNSFFKGYGLAAGDPVVRAELFGNFQEALQFVKRYFLIEGNPDGLDLTIPTSFYRISDVGDLFLMATKNSDKVSEEETLWAEVILKIMHTILHVDKDLRSNYFSVIQTQIFDRFYRYIQRDRDDNLYLGESSDKENWIPLIEFVTKAKKSRESVIIKLLHKVENVAEELFDRVGLRFITKTRFDTLRVIKFLTEKNIVIPHNIKPSRSVNSLVDVDKFKEAYESVVKMSIRNSLSEDRFLHAMEREISDSLSSTEDDAGVRNNHSSNKYKAIQFTCRHLIRYKNPFLQEFRDLRKSAKERKEDDLAQKILAMDSSLIGRDVRFFYPYEVQIVDEESHKDNSEGDASHHEYKKSQVLSAMKRVFAPMIEYKKL